MLGRSVFGLGEGWEDTDNITAKRKLHGMSLSVIYMQDCDRPDYNNAAKFKVTVIYSFKN